MTLGPAEWAFWDSWVRAQRLLVRELDRALQRDHGISKAEFSILMALLRAPGRQLRVGELSEALDWEKSRVSHLLTRMESRDLVEPVESGAPGRRTGVGLTTQGRRVARAAVRGHAGNIRRHFFDTLTPEQAAVIREWSTQTVERLDV
jgi:DNA-binding MarR family transcriptional regulator